MATYKKRLYGTRLDKAIEELDKSVYVVEVDGKKVNDINNSYPKNKTKRLLDEGYKATASKAPKTITNASTSTTKKKKEEKDTWFRKGAFDDGYDFGDITKTILGTTGDVLTGAARGIGSTIEGVGDLLTYGVAEVADLFGADEFADFTRKEASKDDMSEFFEPKEKTLDKYSVLGEKSDAISQGIGQVGLLVASGGLASSGAAATAITSGLTFSSSMGSGMSEAYQGGATDGEAAAYGAIKGAGDAVTELIFGGLGKGINAVGLSKGLSSADDLLAQKLSSKISNKVAKNIVQYGVKAGAEGTEEVLAGVVSAAGKKLTYMSEEEMSKLIEDEQLLDQFIAGAVTSGVAQSGIVPGMKQGSLIESTKAGRDFVTGYTQNEEAVLNSIVDEYSNALTKQKAYENEIEKAITTKETEQGGKLSDKEKNALSEQINSKIESGELDISSTKISNKEISTIREIVEEEMQKGLLDTNKIESILGTTITENDGILAKSYLETARKSENFTYDDAKVTNEQEKAVYDSAAKYFNNTTRSHEFVEKVAKISKDKGTNYGFINNEELKSLGHDVEGKQVNGLVRTNQDGKQTVLINIDSPKALNTIVGHETTHLLEGTQEYTDLQEAIFNYAKEQGDYNGRLDSLNSLYEGIENANIDAELTADLVGDYLFTDENFINSLSTNKPTVFQKIKELIDDLVVRFTGTKEEKALREVQKRFKEAYRKNATQNDTNTKYSFAGKKAAQNSQSALARLETARKLAQEGYTNEETRKKTGWFKGTDGQWRIEISDRDSQIIQKVKANKTYKLSEVLKHDKLYEAYPELKDYKIKFKDIDSSGSFNKLTNSITINNNLTNDLSSLKGTLMHEIQHAIQKREGFARGTYYDEKNAKNYKNSAGEQEARDVRRRLDYSNEQVRDIAPTMSKPDSNRLHQVGLFGKEIEAAKDIKYSLTDNQGRTLTKEQQEYFKDSKVRDENGNLEVVYHSTPNEFTVFDNDMLGENTGYGNTNFGIFVTDNKTFSERFKDIDNNGTEGHTMEMYANVTNPITHPYKAGLKYGEEQASKIVEDYYKAIGETEALDEMQEMIEYEEADNLYDAYMNIVQVDSSGVYEYADSERSRLKEAGYDAVEIIEGYESELVEGSKSDEVVSSYAIFESNQIKNIDNTNPTSDADIRYSLTPDYGMSHRPSTDYGDASNFEENMPDVFEHPEWYFFGGNDARAKRAYRESFEALKKVRNNPDGEITIYRATIGDTFNEGDWVTPSKTYAEWHNYSNLDGKGKVIELKVKAKDIRFAGDDLNEFGYFPNGVDEYSLSRFNEQRAEAKGDYNVYGEDVKLQQAIAPLQEEIKELAETIKEIKVNTEVFKQDTTPTPQDIVEQQNEEAFNNIDESNMPMELEDYIPDGEISDTKSLFETRDYEDVGSRKVNAYQYDNPEVKPYFQQEAKNMLGDLKRSVKGERGYNDNLYYESGGEEGFYGVSRQTTNDIAELLDGVDGKYKYTYAEIEKGLNAIIKDEGSENNAVSKRIEFYLDQRLREGYTDMLGYEIPANQEYMNVLKAREFDDFYNSLTIDDSMMPVENVDNFVDNVSNSNISEKIAPVKEKYLAITPEKEPKLKRVKEEPTYNEIAEILTEEPKTENDRNKRKWAIFKANVLDKGIVFEDLALKENNRELIAKWDYTLTSEARGQYAIGKGHNGSKSLDAIRQEVDNTGLTKDFYNYMYHKHNVDRMTLATRFEGMENKPVFGDSVTADVSQRIVNQYENQHPEFMDFAQDVYDYVNADKQLLVDNGVISQETADLWSEMYPHYVPTRRTTDTGIDINVPLDTMKTGINSPIKKATGGSADILPLFDTMAMRTLQTYRATAKNSFGVELMNTMGTTIESAETNVDEVIDSIDAQDGLLQEGKKGKNPTFTVFEDGEKITFEITKDMYDALKPVSESSLLSKTIKPLNVAGNIRRGLLTEYNPTFMLTNAIKDTQDILLNSQHSLKTYAKIPEAHKQLLTKGYWYQEYIRNGGEQNSYFDNESNTFKTENKSLAKKIALAPLNGISKLNNYVEMIPRLAEYIASRQSGRSIEVSMLDAARVTTNFKAGGAVTKWANRNGATFLNASVQGAMQQVRNIREAKANGIRGWVNLATKFTMAALPAVLLNNLVWEDDEEYEELSDYVKQNYYVVGKNDDGTFIRIPKGRAVAVIQEAVNQMENLITGDDEADLKTFIDLTINNLAPNNPLDNNIFSPIAQVAQNKTWYGGDLVPTRLQDLPAAEQYDESTDEFSKWIGEIFNVSPYKVNYLLDQYSGGVGDVVLPMITPEATSDAETIGGYLTAPFKSKFTTNSTMNNQNISDFYDTSEELTTNAKKSDATDKDVLSNKYINSVKADMNELYKEKREIQNSDLSKSEKYEQVLDIQSQINELAENALSEYSNVNNASNYSTVGDREYYKKINEDGEVEWTKVREEEAADLDSLGLTHSEKNTYFSTKSEISSIVEDYKDNKSDLSGIDEDSDEYKDAVSKLSSEKKVDIVNKIKGTGFTDEQKAYLYKKYYNSDTIDTIVSSGINVDAYLDYSTQDIKADKDKDGDSIPNSRKKKVIAYVNGLDLSIPEKAILIKATNTFKFNEYNKQIVEYVSGLDISDEEKVNILEELDMEVFDDGTVRWE